MSEMKRGENNGLSGIDPAAIGTNIKVLIRKSENTVANIGRKPGVADTSTMYKWIKGDVLLGIDNMMALSIVPGVSINDILVKK